MCIQQKTFVKLQIQRWVKFDTLVHLVGFAIEIKNTNIQNKAHARDRTVFDHKTETVFVQPEA